MHFLPHDLQSRLGRTQILYWPGFANKMLTYIMPMDIAPTYSNVNDPRKKFTQDLIIKIIIDK